MKASVTTKITYREWLVNEAKTLGISCHALEMRLHRGKHPYPAGLVRGRIRRAKHIVIHKEVELSTILNRATK
jgi:hypothetical protein